MTEYRKVKQDERIEKGDELLQGDCKTWLPCGGVGYPADMYYGEAIRRPLTCQHPDAQRVTAFIETFEGENGHMIETPGVIVGVNYCPDCGAISEAKAEAAIADDKGDK